MMPEAAVMPAPAERRKGRKVVGVPAHHAEDDEEHQHADLDQHHHGVCLGGLAHAPDQQQRAQEHQDDRGHVEHPALLGRLRQAFRNPEAKQVVGKLVQVLRPADGDGRGGYAVLQQQAGGDTDGRQLAERRVGVGIRRPRHRYGAGQLGVADRGEPGDHAGDHERHDHRGPGDRDGHREHEEDAGADGGADAEHRQLEHADRAGQFTAAAVGACLLGHLRNGLAAE